MLNQGKEGKMKLKNVDFRSFINETDKCVGESISEVSSSEAMNKKSSVDTITSKERHRQRYLQILNRFKLKEKKKLRDGEANGNTQSYRFRDRAAERRLNKEEYSKATEDFLSMQNRSIEESKYLGGDIEHTHLVKGLDYLLLSKVRSEIEKEKQKKVGEAALLHRAVEDQHEVVAATMETRLMVRKIENELFRSLHPHNLSFNKKLSDLEKLLVSKCWNIYSVSRKRERPSFHTMIYQYDLSSKNLYPVVIFQSGDTNQDSWETIRECEKKFTVCTHSVILKEIAIIFNTKRRKHKNQTRAQDDVKNYIKARQKQLEMLSPFEEVEESQLEVAQAEDVQCDDTEDIFPCAGTFSKEYKKSTIHEPLTANNTATNKSMNNDNSLSGTLMRKNDEGETNVLSPLHYNYFDSPGEGNIEKSQDISNTSSQKINSMIGLSIPKKKLSRAGKNLSRRLPMCTPVNFMGEKDNGENMNDEADFADSLSDEEEEPESRKPRKQFPPGNKRVKLTGRAAKRQAEREWKKVEEIMGKTEVRGLEALQNQLDSTSKKFEMVDIM